MANITYESGHDDSKEKLISLGGVMGSPGRGRVLELGGGAFVSAAKIPDNPKRISLLIQNLAINAIVAQQSDVQVLFPLPNTGYLVLSPGDSIQFDKDLPYTGALIVAAIPGNCTLEWLEISVP
jgi:hypothetical protein